MRRISLGSILLFTAFGLAAGCTSTSMSRFNPFNKNKATSEGCSMDVGMGPVCEGPVMGGGMGMGMGMNLPPESSYMMPGDGTLMPGTIMPGAGTTTGPILQGSGTQNNPNYMPPASGTSSGQPQRLVPQAPIK